VPWQSTVLNEQTVAEKIGTVVGQRDSHCHRQVSRTATQIVIRQNPSATSAAAFDLPRSATAHDGGALQRVERPDQHGGRLTDGFRHDVHHRMDPVVQIDVRVSGAPVHRRIARGRTGRGMTGWIGFANIGFDLDDDAARDDAAAIVDEDLADEVAGDVERRTIVEVTRQLVPVPHLLFSLAPGPTPSAN